MQLPPPNPRKYQSLSKGLIASNGRVQALQRGLVTCDEGVSFHAKNFRPQPTLNQSQSS